MPKKPRNRHVDAVSGVKNGTDFTVRTSISSNFKQLTNVEFLEKYRGKVILCADAYDADEYADSLKALARKYGARVHYADLKENGGEENNSSHSVSERALLAKFAVRKKIAHGVDEKHTMLIDANSFVRDDVGAVCATMDRCGLDVASVEVLRPEVNGAAERLRGTVAVRADLLYPWLSHKSDGEGKKRRRKK